jgi:hypothetical protein
MNALRQIVTQKDGKLSVQLPKEYTQKSFEVIVLPIDEPTDIELIKAKINAFLETLPTDEPDLTTDEILAEVKAVRKDRYDRQNPPHSR